MKLEWGARVLGAAALLAGLMVIIPVPTSLGDGTPERILTGWQGGYRPDTGETFCRFVFQNGGYEDIPAAVPRSAFKASRSRTVWWTAPDLPGVLHEAARQHPHRVERVLGTWDNVAGPLHPFPGRPVAYSAPLIQAMAQHRFNPRSVGGPDIPPGSVGKEILASGLLQIDTRSDNNRLRQLMPGGRPALLKRLYERRALYYTTGRREVDRR